MEMSVADSRSINNERVYGLNYRKKKKFLQGKLFILTNNDFKENNLHLPKNAL